MKKKLMALALAGAFAATFWLGAMAAATNPTIQAILAQNITVKYNGQAKALTDATGSPVSPISYNGTTYLPVRAVAGLLNVAVDWDQATQTVLLGEKEKTLVDQAMAPVVNKNFQLWTSDPEKLNVEGRTYPLGMLISQVSWSFNNLNYINVNVDGKYQSFGASVKNTGEADATIRLYDADTNAMIKEVSVPKGATKVVDIPVGGVKKLKLSNEVPAEMSLKSTSLTWVDLWVK